MHASSASTPQLRHSLPWLLLELFFAFIVLAVIAGWSLQGAAQTNPAAGITPAAPSAPEAPLSIGAWAIGLLIVQQLTKLLSTIHTPDPSLAAYPRWYQVAHYLCDAFLRIKPAQLGIAPSPSVLPAAQSSMALTPKRNSAPGHIGIRLAITTAITGLVVLFAALLCSGCASTPINQSTVSTIETITETAVEAIILGFQDYSAVKSVPAADITAANDAIAAYRAAQAAVNSATTSYFASLGTNAPTLGGLALALEAQNAQLLTAAKNVRATIMAAEGKAQ